MKKWKQLQGVRSEIVDSSLYNIFPEEVNEHVCCQGTITFKNNAVFHGALCYRAFEKTNHEHENQLPFESATIFLTPTGQCIRGRWRFVTLQCNIGFQGVDCFVAVYSVQGEILIVDCVPQPYTGYALLNLKEGKVKILKTYSQNYILDHHVIDSYNIEDEFEQEPNEFVKKNSTTSLEQNETGYSSKKIAPRTAYQPYRKKSHITQHQDPHKYQRTDKQNKEPLKLGLTGCVDAGCPWHNIIAQDLERTHFHRFTDTTSASARQKLYYVLRYMANAYPAVGYCQGMHCVAKYLLMISKVPDCAEKISAPIGINISKPSPKDTTDINRTLALLTKIWRDDSYRLHELFGPSLIFFKSISEEVDNGVEASEPLLKAHLDKIGLSAVVYAAKWILTLFTFYMDQDLYSVTNIWLRFLSNGWTAIVQASVACVCVVKEQLMVSGLDKCLLILSGTTAHTPKGLLEKVFSTPAGVSLLGSNYKKEIPH